MVKNCLSHSCKLGITAFVDSVYQFVDTVALQGLKQAWDRDNSSKNLTIKTTQN